MPAVSQSQAHKIAMLYREGKVSRRVLDDYVKGVRVRDLPKHKRKSKRGRKRTSRR